MRITWKYDDNNVVYFNISPTLNTKEVIGLYWRSLAVIHLWNDFDVVLSNSVRLTRCWRYNSATKVVTYSCPDSPMPYVQANYAITGTPVDFPATTRFWVMQDAYKANGFTGPVAAWNRRISDSELTYAMTDLWRLEELFAGDSLFKMYYKLDQRTVVSATNYAPSPIGGSLIPTIPGDSRLRFSPLEM